MSLDVAVGLGVVFAVIALLAGCFFLFQRNWLLGWVKGTVGLLLLVGAGYFALFSVNLLNYQRLMEGQPVATVSMEEKAPQVFVVTVTGTGDQGQTVELQGDLWQLDARVIRWKGFLQLLGLQPAYQLDRVQGRYLSLQEEQERNRTVYSMAKPGLVFDLWESAVGGNSMLVDARYGSAAYVPMADGAIYEVTLGSSGLVAETVA